MQKNLNRVVTGKIKSPLRVVLYGPEGVGKSTWASQAPSHVFLGERGTDHLNVSRIPTEELKTFRDVIEWIDQLIKEPHEFQTLVVDTLDWLEPLIWEDVAQRNAWASINDPPFAAGYKEAVLAWDVFLSRLDLLRDVKGMHIVLLAQVQVSRTKNPIGEDWDRYSLKIYDSKSGSASARVKEWSDNVIFVNYDERKVTKGAWNPKGGGSGRRIAHTMRNAAYDAKNRLDLPEQVDLHELWALLLAGSEAAPTTPAAPPRDSKWQELAEETYQLALGVSEGYADEIGKVMDSAVNDMEALVEIKARVIAMRGEKAKAVDPEPASELAASAALFPVEDPEPVASGQTVDH